MNDVDVEVVGSGPNGLAAAIVLARAGLRVRVREAEPTIGGGTRTAAVTLPGFLHDVCAAVHPLAVASPLFRGLPLADHGLAWVEPDVALAHPLDDGGAVSLLPTVEQTAAALGEDAGPYRRILAPLVGRFDDLTDDVLAPIWRVPRHPLVLARFGLRAALSAAAFVSGAFAGERARALFGGLAAHSFMALDAPFTAASALLLAAAAHGRGWPIARGGSQSVATALAGCLGAFGGQIVVGDRVETLARLEGARAIVFDTSPAVLAQVAGERLPSSYRRRLLRWRRGPGIFKVDYALSAPVPWRAPDCRRAGTVHLGGRFAEIARSEGEVARGALPERPFVLVAQQSLFDETRAPPGRHTLWAYCHVPNGSTTDMTPRIEAQIERFAPGFADVVLARAVTRPADVAAHNANCAGGDISGGISGALSLFARPMLALDPYATAASELYLCSASTPPGAGVHGMCGHHAAVSVLRRSFGA